MDHFIIGSNTGPARFDLRVRPDRWVRPVAIIVSRSRLRRKVLACDSV